MTLDILIVEDEFIVANDLKIKILRAGYGVSGIAASVNEAVDHIEKQKPDLVLLDIFLQDESMGTDLAHYLNEKTIGFIYISANTNQSVLEAVKLTHPFGFLVKPFREQDLLVMLDIAGNKHRLQQEQSLQRSVAWKREISLLAELRAKGETEPVKIISGIQPFIPFDLLRLRYHNRLNQPTEEFNFLRTGFDEYQTVAGKLQWKNTNPPAAFGISDGQTGYLNRHAFRKFAERDKGEASVADQYQLSSKLLFNLDLPNGETVVISFFSKRDDSYSDTHLSLLSGSSKTLGILFFSKIFSSQPGLPAGSGNNSPTVSTTRSSAKFTDIIGSSSAIVDVMDKIEIVASANTTVLITGESGTGKENVAKSIHRHSGRNKRPMIVINCGALPSELIESELFGHEKGAFTGASERRIGKFEQANGGTLFLDEIGELPLQAQVKLLRVLQEKEVERVGSGQPIKIDVRVISATNRNLEKEVAAGRFRLDLYYRLNVFPIEMPALREHKEDIPLLAAHFIGKFSQAMNRNIAGIGDKALQTLMQYHWPGNVRELEHVIERSCLVTKGTMITQTHLDNQTAVPEPEKKQTTGTTQTLEEIEAAYIIEVLKRCNGRISGPGGAAEILGLPSTTLHSKIKKLGIRKSIN